MPHEPLLEDGLREVGDMSAGAASAALADLLGTRTTHVTSQFHAVPARELSEALGVPDVPRVGASVPLRGSLEGALLVALSEEDADAFRSRLYEAAREPPPNFAPQALLDEAETLREAVSITAGAYLRTFYGFLGFDVRFGVPAFVTARWPAMVRYTFLGNAPKAFDVWVVQSRLRFRGVGEADVYLLMPGDAVETVGNALEERARPP